MRCANPQCQIESNYLRDGSLYSIDELLMPGGIPQRRFIWLCKQCSPGFVVQTWRPPGEQLVLKAPTPVSYGAPRRPARRATGGRTLPISQAPVNEGKQRARV